MTTIYLASIGNYSEYYIAGVFSTKELAEKYLEGIEEVNPVEEMELDKFAEDIQAGRFPYDVDMYLDNGDTKKVRKRLIDTSFQPDRKIPIVVDEYQHKNGKSLATGRKIYKVLVIARDAEHAVKIANEKRAQYLASS